MNAIKIKDKADLITRSLSAPTSDSRTMNNGGSPTASADFIEQGRPLIYYGVTRLEYSSK